MILRAAQRAAELNRAKSEAIAKLICRASQALELLAPLRIKKADLICAVGEHAEFNADQANRPAIPMLLEKPAQRPEKDRIEMRGLGQRFGPCDGLKSRVPDSERNRASVQARIAQSFGALLTEVAQHGFQSGPVFCIGAKSVAVGYRFGLRIDHEFVRILASCFAVERRAPLPEDFLQSFFRNTRELPHGFDPHRAQRGLCHTSDSWNTAHRKRLEKFGLHT